LYIIVLFLLKNESLTKLNSYIFCILSSILNDGFLKFLLETKPKVNISLRLAKNFHEVSLEVCYLTDFNKNVIKIIGDCRDHGKKIL